MKKGSVKLFFFIIFPFYSIPVYGLNQLSFNVDKIIAEDWQLKNVQLSVFDISKKSQQFTASIKKLSLPDPFTEISFLDVQCSIFTWQQKQIVCKKGKAKLKSGMFTSKSVDFYFSITEKKTRFHLNNLSVAKGALSINAEEEKGEWLLLIKCKGIQLKKIESLLTKYGWAMGDINSGTMDAEIEIRGNQKGLDNLLIKADFENVTVQADQGKIATDSLSFRIRSQAETVKEKWQWHIENQVMKGELYFDPVFLQIKENNLLASGSGIWSESDGLIINQAVFDHSPVIKIDLDGVIKQRPDFAVNAANIFFDVNDLEAFSGHYLSPFFEQTLFEGVVLKGKMESVIQLSQSEIKQVTGAFNNISVVDNKQRISVNNATGKLNWSDQPNFLIPSYIAWDELKIKAIPVEAGQLDFLSSRKNIKLLKQSIVPLLGGAIDIQEFNWQHGMQDSPKVYFKGGVRDLSLEQLTLALDWTPLSGTISGYIPGVDYENKTLTIDGELKVRVFDGTIKIKKLASSGMFSNFSKLNLDMEIDNLDLLALTKKFQTGSIEGRLSGSVDNLYLENWKPVTFYAWLGTPEGDESKHRISQKAVENIASIGGGGAADLISKGFLRFFDTFSYEHLGFGCYLHHGVCQIMGVEATEQGYYLIKGGGLPRIDVIGYNTQVDWNVLIERLSRISDTDEVLIE